MVDSQDDISNKEKLKFLKACLSGQAKNKIENLLLTADKYPRAWKILEKSYADNRLIISKHLKIF